MAFTEKYVTVAGAGAHDGSSEANAWTFAEMIAAAPAAETRVNMKAGAYSEGATTLPSSGTISAPIVIRGYSSSIGDLDDQGRGTDGLLNTTNMPDMTITSTWTPSPWCICQNIDFAGAISAYLIGNTSADSYGYVNCRFTNSQNNAAAGCIQGDNYVFAVNCDFVCSGAAHAVVVDCDADLFLYGCRVATTSTSATACVCFSGIVSHCAFVGTGAPNTGVAIDMQTQGIGTAAAGVLNTTIYNFGTAILTPNVAPASRTISLINNHITDCGAYIDSQYDATANIAIVEMYNRLRDNTTPRTGVLSITDGGEVTTDSGDYTTDYVSATNLRLIYGAAGVAVGMMPSQDIGAFQRARPTLPADEDVQDGVSYGDGGTQYEGDFVAPAESDVLSDVQYGGDGTEYTGTYAGGGGGASPVFGDKTGGKF